MAVYLALGDSISIDESAVTADYKNGVLEVHVRKPEQPKPKRIQVGSTSTATIEGKTEKK
jgi:hypothetical protein